jgi:Concanavalin A-like lectin/glucanases superfamily
MKKSICTITTVFAASIASYSQNPRATVDNGLLNDLYAYFKLDEASGDALDASRSGLDLENAGQTIGTTTGKINGARLWNSGGPAWFNESDTTKFSPGAQHFSFSVWVNLANLVQGGGDTGILVKTGTATDREYIFYFRVATGKWALLCALDDTHWTQMEYSVAPVAGTWYHCAGGWDGSKMWLNINDSGRQTADFTGPIQASTSSDFMIGLEDGSGSSFSGIMDEIGFWMGRDLTDDEVSQLYNGGAGLPFESFRLPAPRIHLTPLPRPTLPR